MLAFLTTLRHPDNSSDYLRVESLLKGTLASVNRQDHPDFCIIIVGNRCPSFVLPEKAIFVNVDFPAPSAIKSPNTERNSVLLDKGSKLAIAVLAGLEAEATHLMTADADDYFSCRLAGFISHQPSAPGWYVDNGYQYSERRRLIREINGGFNDLCGSSLIYRADLLDAPSISIQSSQEEVLARFGHDNVLSLLGSHRLMRRHLEGLGQPLTPLPFPGAIYNVDTAENWSGNTFHNIGRPVSASIAEEFGLSSGRPMDFLRCASGIATMPATRAWRFTAQLWQSRYEASHSEQRSQEPPA